MHIFCFFVPFVSNNQSLVEIMSNLLGRCINLIVSHLRKGKCLNLLIFMQSKFQQIKFQNFVGNFNNQFRLILWRC